MKNRQTTKYFSINLALLFVALFSSFSVNSNSREVVIFKTKAGVTSQEVIQSANDMLLVMQTWDAFLSRELVDMGEGRWMDVVLWKNRAGWEKAFEKAMNDEACLKFFSLIDQEQQSINFGTIRLSSEKESNQKELH